MFHTKKGNYNPETSICIQQLNYACTEQQLTEEINLILRDERNKREKQNPEEEGISSSKKDFIMSCIIFVDKVTKQSKQFAFVDFSSAHAAKVCKEAWNENKMNKYPNRLSVSMYDSSHVKLTKEERDRTKTRERQSYTNLFIDKLPYAFGRQDVLDLFSKFGTVLDVKIKKPTSNVQLKDIHNLPCSAYVNFKDQVQAKAAVEALNGKVIFPGGKSLRIDYY
jgi:RNA recognition motif-containing protein